MRGGRGCKEAAAREPQGHARWGRAGGGGGPHATTRRRGVLAEGANLLAGECTCAGHCRLHAGGAGQFHQEIASLWRGRQQSAPLLPKAVVLPKAVGAKKLDSGNIKGALDKLETKDRRGTKVTGRAYVGRVHM